MKNVLFKILIASAIIISGNAVMAQSSMSSSPAHPNTNSGEIAVPTIATSKDNVNTTTTGSDHQPAGPDAFDKSESRKLTKEEKKDEKKEEKIERKDERAGKASDDAHGQGTISTSPAHSPQ